MILCALSLPTSLQPPSPAALPGPTPLFCPAHTPSFHLKPLQQQPSPLNFSSGSAARPGFNTCHSKSRPLLPFCTKLLQALALRFISPVFRHLPLVPTAAVFGHLTPASCNAPTPSLSPTTTLTAASPLALSSSYRSPYAKPFKEHAPFLSLCPKVLLTRPLDSPCPATGAPPPFPAMSPTASSHLPPFCLPQNPLTPTNRHFALPTPDPTAFSTFLSPPCTPLPPTHLSSHLKPPQLQPLTHLQPALLLPPYHP